MQVSAPTPAPLVVSDAHEDAVASEASSPRGSSALLPASPSMHTARTHHISQGFVGEASSPRGLAALPTLGSTDSMCISSVEASSPRGSSALHGMHDELDLTDQFPHGFYTLTVDNCSDSEDTEDPWDEYDGLRHLHSPRRIFTTPSLSDYEPFIATNQSLAEGVSPLDHDEEHPSRESSSNNAGVSEPEGPSLGSGGEGPEEMVVFLREAREQLDRDAPQVASDHANDLEAPSDCRNLASIKETTTLWSDRVSEADTSSQSTTSADYPS